MDLVIDPDPVNAAKLDAILNSWGIPSAKMNRPGLQVVLKKIHNADLLTPPLEWPIFAEISDHALRCWVGGEIVPVASVLSLIRLKQIACTAQADDAEKHLSDIAALKGVLTASV